MNTDKPLPVSNEPAKADLDPVFTAVAKYFGLLAEPTRLKILHSICDTERQVSAIVGETGASQTNVSRHLSLMHQADRRAATAARRAARLRRAALTVTRRRSSAIPPGGGVAGKRVWWHGGAFRRPMPERHRRQAASYQEEHG